MRVVVGQLRQSDFIDRRDLDVTRARNVATLAGPHSAEFPKPDRLRLFTAANLVQKLLLEEQHAVPRGKLRNCGSSYTNPAIDRRLVVSGGAT